MIFGSRLTINPYRMDPKEKKENLPFIQSCIYELCSCSIYCILCKKLYKYIQQTIHCNQILFAYCWHFHTNIEVFLCFFWIAIYHVSRKWNGKQENCCLKTPCYDPVLQGDVYVIPSLLEPLRLTEYFHDFDSLPNLFWKKAQFVFTTRL